MDEQRAIQLCVRHRDPLGFEFLVEKFRKEALFHAFGLLGNLEDAADACQEAFTRAFVAMPQLAALDQFYPWFYRILRNHCLNVLKKQSVAKRSLEARGEADPTNPSSAPDPSFLILANEEQREVWAALEQLEPDHREILVMKYIRSQTYDEIAAVLDVPRGTVMSRLFHARKKFRTKYMAERSAPGAVNHTDTVMKPAPEKTCETMRPLIVGLLDRELNESETRLVNEHLIRCEDCRNEYDRLSETQAPLNRVSFAEPTDDVLNRLWKKPYDRVAWLTGLWLSLGGIVLVLGYALYEFIAHFEFDSFFSGDDPALPRIGFAAVCAGVVLLLIQTIRNRIKTYRVDPYKHVKR